MANIILRGSINNVLFSDVSENNLIRTNPAETGFSFGLGAIQEDNGFQNNSLGEFLTFPTLSAVLPADGEFKPGFSGAYSDFYTPFNVSLSGMGSNKFTKAEINGSSINLTEFWNHLFSKQDANIKDAALLGMVAVAKIDELKSAFVIQPPVCKNKPETGVPISDPSVYSSWFRVDTDNEYKDHWGIIVGVGINMDRAHNLEGLEKGIFYSHPSSVTAGSIMVHQHIIIGNKNKPDINAGDSALKIAETFGAENFQNIKHVLDNSSFSANILC